jgi:hypothetical protein
MSHLLDNGLLNPSQHGFMSKKSCMTNLLEFFEVVTSAVDYGDAVDAVFLDFAKAFDKVPRNQEKTNKQNACPWCDKEPAALDSQLA